LPAAIFAMFLAETAGSRSLKGKALVRLDNSLANLLL